MGKGQPPPRAAIIAWSSISLVTVIFGVALATGLVEDETGPEPSLGFALIGIGSAALLWQVIVLRR